MPVDALRDLLKKAKVTFRGKAQKPELIEKALASQKAMAIVEAEARAQGEHIDGANLEVETVEGSFVDIDSSILVQGTQRAGARQTSVRPSTLATNMRLHILTMTS
jgi:hypothetical protein